ncbi:hypothetical protein Aam_016_065 [Acidocella aminolytica 101 = DSM 11237]|uniref:Uncharacterized protein n=1 Tax=Acidocella aminolytica 101 = DSM 11237 TaxID=1120923 RepID=A0A0D6PBE6_9PROT|nr:hypothetical protein [Acidocella aminolytica]GAN79095.1 hypothetical protein Aam_016_065 [Acidocella aminolytica 101 = DSM 11237]
MDQIVIINEEILMTGPTQLLPKPALTDIEYMPAEDISFFKSGVPTVTKLRTGTY